MDLVLRNTGIYALLLISLVLHRPGFAADKTYALTPQQVAPDVYVFVGKTEHFSFANGGNIVNTGFIIGRDGVIVIDSGPSWRYGKEMRAAIEQVTDKPIAKVLISHFHPDHFLGNQGFADTKIVALPETVKGIRQQGELFNDAMYRLVGPWMKGTEVVVPNRLDFQQFVTIAGRKLKLIKLSGHSGSDLAVFDQFSGVLFAADSVFFERTPTTPHADIEQWLHELKLLEDIPFKVLVPGHGPVVTDKRAIRQTADYLAWLQKSLTRLADQGQSMAEALQPDASGERFFDLAVFSEEYQRSVAHLYPGIEQKILQQGRVEQNEP